MCKVYFLNLHNLAVKESFFIFNKNYRETYGHAKRFALGTTLKNILICTFE